MEIEPSPPVAAKKVWNIVRVLFFMLRKGIAKSKIMVEFHWMLKRVKLAGKALVNSVVLHHHFAAFACHSHDTHLSFISPREYEFSCSNSPANPLPAINKRKHHHHQLSRFSKSKQYDDVSTLNAVQKVLEMLNNEKVEASPSVTLPGFGFGKSPLVRQLRVTDSPFPLKDEGDSKVDMAAEEFINKFYKDLNLQKRMASTLESPYHNFWNR
ncbi:uncharacterized protein LOC133313773 [Gastrolobium bilobum]|uniref:uncharacterized protein LOC133313773 n=1 Tax=Gastrolobium bilobum TaxID=150636 RepID=UPI002AB10BF1|nr:uncharacterized protein LOC133313773 [Gastrolobium bilobum]